MCQYRYVKFHCTCDGQVWFKACANPIPAPELNIGYSLCRQKSFQSPYTATFRAVCCCCFTLRLQTGGYSIDAHAIISEFNEGVREVLGESTNGEPWIQLRSLAGAQWEHLILRSAKSVEDELEGLGNLSLGEQIAYTKHHSRGKELLRNTAIKLGEYGVGDICCGDGTSSVEGVDGVGGKTVEDISQALDSMYI